MIIALCVVTFICFLICLFGMIVNATDGELELAMLEGVVAVVFALCTMVMSMQI